jgi:hypothetical protein
MARAMMVLQGPGTIFSKMEDKVGDCLEPDASASEPECEIHSSNEQRELQERLDNITSLQDLFVKQSQTLALIEPDSMADFFFVSPHPQDVSVGSFTSCLSGCKSFEGTVDAETETLQNTHGNNGRDISPTSVATMGFFESSCFKGIEKTLDFEEAEDIDSSTQPSVEGSDSEIQAAINEIRKEASQLSVVMALDQLKTKEAELDVSTRALRERSLEADDLRGQLREREERISCLELERDLYMADASKLRVDLKTCVDRMFDISAVAGTSTFVEGSDGGTGGERIRDQAILRPSVSPLDSRIPAIPSSVPLDDQSDSDQPKQVDRHIPQKNHVSLARRDLPRMSEIRESAVARAFPLRDSGHPSSIFRENSITTSPPRSLSMISASTRSRTLDSPRRNRSFSEVIRSSTQPTSEDEDTGNENRMCGLFRRRQQNRSIAKAKDVTAMRSKIDQLHMMMRTSLETSEKLRKRLAMISGYYEGIILKLQEQVIEAKTEKSKIKADCNSKVSAIDYEKRIASIHLENKLRESERELHELRKKVDVPPYEI